MVVKLLKNMFGAQAYCPEVHGSLEDYLLDRDMKGISNLFYGPEYFHVLHGMRLIVPKQTTIAVCRDYFPDELYLITPGFKLYSPGPNSHMKMSANYLDIGVYDVSKTLLDEIWSAECLDITRLLKH